MNLDHISTDHVELNGPKGQFMIYKPTHPGKSVRKVIGSHLSKEMGLKDKMGGNIEEFPQELQMRDFPIFNLAE